MKTLDQIYGEIVKNEDMKKGFALAMKENTVESFLKDHGCDATAAEVIEYLEKTKKTELTVDDMNKVAGGWCTSFTCVYTCGCSA